ncbi:hypothetical protein [Spirosoma rigui]|uniref:hypothetical protein n=1 Tax=Spirosoma rigui TaxID=564064 RepID=UPI0012D2C848|nr:hypothetical protein [Spirosoma rigui]
MTRFFLLFTSFVILVSITTSCIDHRLGGPLSPTRSRLTRIENRITKQITIYTYDQANRPASFSVSDGRSGRYEYNDAVRSAGRLFLSDSTVLSISDPAGQLPGPEAKRGFTTNLYDVINGNPAHFLYGGIYTLDSTGQLTEANLLVSGQATNGRFVSGGNNVVSSSVNTMRFRSRYTYSHDSHINPFYGLVGETIYPFNPSSLREGGRREALQFSRNNITEIANVDGNGVTTYTYTYNSEGLPITLQGENTDFIFTYEQY